MASQKQLTLKVINEDGVLYYGNCDVVFVPSLRDVIAVMAFHTPMIMKLGPGTVTVREKHKNQQIAEIKAGLLYVGDNEATVLISKASDSKHG